MDRINQFELYQLGQTLDKLRHHEGGVRPHGVFTELLAASSALSKLRKGEPLPIGVSASRAGELENVIDNLINEHFSAVEDGKKVFRWPAADAEDIPEWRWKSMVEALEKFETVFAEEMRDIGTYYVPRRGIFNTKALVDSADESFPKEIGVFISEKTRAEWRAAGRCLAFHLLSATGFHVARAVEATME